VRDVLTSPMYRHYLNQLPRSRPLRVLDHRRRRGRIRAAVESDGDARRAHRVASK
jgi:hypothetical protein